MMRNFARVWLLVACLTMLIPAVCGAGPISYYGVFADDSHHICEVWIPAPYLGYTAWVWILPSDNGVMCAEYQVNLPASHLATGTIANPAHSVALGDPMSGVSICFAACQNDWVWTHQISVLPTVAGLPGMISIQKHPDEDEIHVANCLDGYPIEPATILTHLMINQTCG